MSSCLTRHHRHPAHAKRFLILDQPRKTVPINSPVKAANFTATHLTFGAAVHEYKVGYKSAFSSCLLTGALVLY